MLRKRISCQDPRRRGCVHTTTFSRALSLSATRISPSDKSSSSCPHVRRECTAMLRSGSLPLCRNQLSRRLTMAFKPILFGVALAAGGASGQVPIAGDTRGPLSQRWPAVPALFVLEAAPTRFLDTPLPSPFFFFFFAPLFHSDRRRSASDSGGTPQRRKCVKCA